jgi:hypothetical protein
MSRKNVEIDDNQFRIHTYANGDTSLVDGKFHKIDEREEFSNERGLTDEQLERADRLCDSGMTYNEALCRLGYIQRDCEKNISDYEKVISIVPSNPEIAVEQNSEASKKLAARAILDAFRYLGNYSKDYGLVKCAESNHPKARSIDIRKVSKAAMENYSKATELIIENSNSEVMKNVIGIDINAIDPETGQPLYDNYKDFVGAVREKYYPKVYDKKAELDRGRARRALRKIADEQGLRDLPSFD